MCITCFSATMSDESYIKKLLDDIPVDGGIILLPNSTINITSPIIIYKSNIAIVGDTNTIFLLSSNVNCPVIVVGIQGSECVSNVVLMNIQIDGNRTNQSKELWKLSPLGYPMYNNGVIIQNSKDVFINDVTIHNCISGGLVTTFGVLNLVVSNYVAFNNQFDGIACYQTTNCLFQNLLIFNNLAAGISLDMNFTTNIFDNVLLISNNTGIFIRDSNGNIFSKIRMIDNKRFDIFMVSIDNRTNTGCLYNIFDIKGDGIIRNNDSLCVSNIFKRKLGK